MRPSRMLTLLLIAALLSMACGGVRPHAQALLPLPDQRAAVGSQASFQAIRAPGTSPVNAHWKVNGKETPGAVSSLTLGPLGVSDDGSILDFRIEAGSGEDVSRTALLSVRTGNPHPSEGWTAIIQGFHAQDTKTPPPPGCTLFAGSSTIVGWDLERSFPGRGCVNRGFGGSSYRDVLYHSQDVILKYTPGCVVLYAGDNDLASGLSPAQIAETLRRLVLRIQGNLPGVRVVVLGIKPSLARWSLWEQARSANAMIRHHLLELGGCLLVEPAWVLLGADGRPDRTLFHADGLHLNAIGYARLATLVRPLLP